MSVALSFGIPLALAALAAVALWPRAPRLSASLWALGLPSFLWAFWGAPGFVPGFFGLGLTFFVLRAWTAVREAPDFSRARYLRYVLDFSQVVPAQQEPPPPRPQVWRRARRGLALGALGGALIGLGSSIQLWRAHPFLEDLYVVVETALVGTCAADLLVAGLWLGGHRMPDLHDGSFVRACSLRDFWRRWNGAVSCVLGYACFQPLARQRRRLGPRLALALGALAAFAASGFLHAFPLLCATESRRLNALLAASTLAFFLLHGLGAIVEGAFPRAWRSGWQGRVWVLGLFAATSWLYPGPLAALFGLHGRTYDSLTSLQLLRALGLV
ncbi:MAG: MBOAT family protein [Planctomycetota bacterium]